jgi:hypothetical protein
VLNYVHENTYLCDIDIRYEHLHTLKQHHFYPHPPVTKLGDLITINPPVCFDILINAKYDFGKVRFDGPYEPFGSFSNNKLESSLLNLFIHRWCCEFDTDIDDFENMRFETRVKWFNYFCGLHTDPAKHLKHITDYIRCVLRLGVWNFMEPDGEHILLRRKDNLTKVLKCITSL